MSFPPISLAGECVATIIDPRPYLRISRAPRKWRADEKLTPAKLAAISIRYSIHHFILCRACRIDPRTLERWAGLPANDSRHPMPIAATISVGLAWVITNYAIDQIEHNAPFVTPEQRARVLRVLGVEEAHG